MDMKAFMNEFSNEQWDMLVSQLKWAQAVPDEVLDWMIDEIKGALDNGREAFEAADYRSELSAHESESWRDSLDVLNDVLIKLIACRFEF